MDILSHAAWGATLVRKRPLVWWALLFGIAPDILGSGPGALYLMFVKGVLWGNNTWQLLPEFLRQNYELWHSLFGLAIFGIILLLIQRRFLILLLPYFFHIVLDLFTHKTDILSRLFYPFVRYNMNRVTGMNWWENGYIWWFSTAILVLVNILIYRRQKNGL